jgi:L-ascorbate metabolism protein UlaG (beta-lactamase superfamily)
VKEDVIEPTAVGSALVQRICAPVTAGSVSVWPLGQSGVILRFSDTIAILDPYLSNHCEAVLARPFDHRRLTVAPLEPTQLSFVDVVLCTHNHLDHLDVPTIRTLGSSTQAQIVVPVRSAQAIAALDWPAHRIVASRGGEKLSLGSVTVTTFPVAHEDYDEDPKLGYPYQGYCVSDGHVSVAHVGDALADERLAKTLRSLEPDLACLPINGRDAARAQMGFAGNMNAEESIWLADRSGIRLVLPMHDDMFPQNVDVDARSRFQRAARAAGIEIVRPRVGEGAIVTARS